MSQTLATLLALVPLAAAFATLIAGRYPGERLLAATRTPPRRRAPRSIGSARRPNRRAGSRGVGLLSFGLGGRAPPLPALG